MRIFFFLLLITFSSLSFATPNKLSPTKGKHGRLLKCSNSSHMGTNNLLTGKNYGSELKRWNVEVWIKSNKVHKVTSNSKDLTNRVSKILSQTFYSDQDCVMRLKVKYVDTPNR